MDNNMNNQFNNQNNMYNQPQVNQNMQPQQMPNVMPNTGMNQQMPNMMPNQNMASNGLTPGMTPPKKTNNLLIIIIAITVIAVIVGVVLLSQDKDKDTSTDKKEDTKTDVVEDDIEDIEEEIEDKEEANLTANIESSGTLATDGNFVIFVKNKNKVPVDIDVEVEFYDANGKLLGSDEIYAFGVGANAEIADYVYDTPEGFSTYKIYADAEATSVKTYYDDIEITHNDSGEEILVQAKNNSQDEIEEVNVTVVFYKGETVVGVDYDFEFELKAGRTANFSFYYPYDKNWKDLEFDTYKVYLVDAYTLDF